MKLRQNFETLLMLTLKTTIEIIIFIRNYNLIYFLQFPSVQYLSTI